MLQIDYAAVAKCEGTSVKQVQWRFWYLKTSISSQENATPGADTETKQGRAQKDKQEGNGAKENN